MTVVELRSYSEGASERGKWSVIEMLTLKEVSDGRTRFSKNCFAVLEK